MLPKFVWGYFFLSDPTSRQVNNYNQHSGVLPSHPHIELYHTDLQVGLVTRYVLSKFLLFLFRITIKTRCLCRNICCNILTETAHILHNACHCIFLHKKLSLLYFSSSSSVYFIVSHIFNSSSVNSLSVHFITPLQYNLQVCLGKKLILGYFKGIHYAFSNWHWCCCFYLLPCNPNFPPLTLPLLLRIL